MTAWGNEERSSSEASASSTPSFATSDVQLPNDALVVRGGILALEDLFNTVEVAIVKMGKPGISVFAVDVDDPEVLLETVGRRVPHLTVSFTRMGRLRQKGFKIQQTLVPPHHSVWLPEEDEDDREYWLREFRNSFDPPRAREGLGGYVVGTC